MAVAEGKKRYYLTLTESTYEQYKAILSGMGAPKGTESMLVDEYLKGMVHAVLPVITRVQHEGRKLTFGEFMVLVGTALNAHDDQLRL